MGNEPIALFPESGCLPGQADWLVALRESARALFLRQGLPGQDAEAWRYSRQKLKSLIRGVFHPVSGNTPLPGIFPAQEGELDIAGAMRIVLLNGQPVFPSERADFPSGLSVFSLGDVLRTAPEMVVDMLGQKVPLDAAPFVALNTALLSSGLVIRVANGVRIDQPLHLVFVTLPEEKSLVVAPRLLVILGEGASLILAESHVGGGGETSLVTSVSEVTIGRNAILTHGLLQNQGHDTLHVATTQAVVGGTGRYERFILSKGAAFGRDEVRVELVGQGAEAQLNGAYMVSGRRHLDTANLIDHVAPGCFSSQIYKGIADDEGRAVFQGRVHIRPGTRKSSGRQLHKALLLSGRAEVDAKPELTIFADDVQCSHGATVGDLDDQALFYLRARGVDEATARTMLVEGFLAGIVETVSHAVLRDALRAQVCFDPRGYGPTHKGMEEEKSDFHCS